VNRYSANSDGVKTFPSKERDPHGSPPGPGPSPRLARYTQDC
jgi:hypothetical protein